MYFCSFKLFKNAGSKPPVKIKVFVKKSTLTIFIVQINFNIHLNVIELIS